MDKAQTDGAIVKLSVGVTIFSVINYWVNGLISTYYYTSNYKAQYSALLIGSAVIALSGLILSVIAIIKTPRRKGLLLLCIFITFLMLALEILSVFFQNSLR